MNVLYCGDDEIACLYIEGALDYLEHSYKHIAPNQTFSGLQGESALILSDYHSRNISREQAAAIEKFVAKGGRLIMIGGWESFNGLGHNYFGHPISELLPVGLRDGDDRVQRPLVIRPTDETRGRYPLAWDNPPVICGYNAAKVRPTAKVLIEIAPIETDGRTIQLSDPLPLVSVIAHGEGTVVACQTDLAPHWSGSLGDWGETRLTLSTGKEVGSEFPKFLQLLLEASA